MKKLQSKKEIRNFILLSCLVYSVSYLTRKNYDAALLEINTSMGIAKTLASLASTGALITYGAGQLLSGVLGDKLKPHNIIFTGLVVTGICNLLMPLCPNIYFMIAVWCVNGLAQAMMWPPLVKIMSELLSAENYRKGVLYVTIASGSSTILVYLLIPFCISISRWQTAFFFCSSCALLMAIGWKIYMNRFEKKNGFVVSNEKDTVSTSEKESVSVPKGFVFACGLIPIAIAIVLQGTLRDGVATWLPTIVSEVYSFDSSKSILSAVFNPTLAIFSSVLASAVQKKVRNEVVSAGIFFGVAMVAALLNLKFYSLSPVACVFLLSLITACMHGINLMLVCEVPNKFAKFNKVSTISGVLNSFTYVGAAVSIYVIAFISERFNNWNVNFVIWTMICLAGIAFCLIALPKWKKMSEKEN